ncbi:HEAT repeat domain-containing protein [Acaryochloris sp. CCMEE 5410]|uniref:HEAT repeat domain-containing protein n=1 Tax=Acaryochloris sp. CCMEE 5410 TaxID=310037 RepID=UPI000585775D|nr:HEAT repeat domain-containing protein [Acaryochloris sp. CCMEE 5410]KAI9133699.1 HEAT repeat domain-containing protein [Acaryochloris sp. CCMEE 5410]
MNDSLTTLPTDQLLSQAEQCARSDDDESDLYGDILYALHLRSDSLIFDTAVEWCKSSDFCMRALGAAVLSQLGCADRHSPYPFGDAALPILLSLLHDPETDVLCSAINALGHHASYDFLWDSSELVAFANHDSADVRCSVAYALGGPQCDRSDLAVAMMCRLAQDDDYDVRNWALFGLGNLSDADSPQVREVLFQGLSDPDDEIRGEAVMGLAKRQDTRVIPVMLKELALPSVDNLVIEAAVEFPQPQYLVHLEELLAANPDDYDLNEAVKKCSQL